MTERRQQSGDPSVFDSALADAIFSPEEIAVLDLVYTAVCDRAALHKPVTDGIRSLLASAILEGAMQGIWGPDELSSFALRTLPEFRSQRLEG